MPINIHSNGKFENKKPDYIVYHTLINKKKTLVVAFRGSFTFADYRTDINGVLRTHFMIGDKEISVHRGFGKKYESYAECLSGTVECALTYGIEEILVTGHSLGGALASLTALHLKSLNFGIPIKLITVGSPRVFATKSANVAEDIIGRENILRIWRKGDIFTSLPPGRTLYRHIGIPITFNGNTVNSHLGVGLKKNHSVVSIAADSLYLMSMRYANNNFIDKEVNRTYFVSNFFNMIGSFFPSLGKKNLQLKNTEDKIMIDDSLKIAQEASSVHESAQKEKAKANLNVDKEKEEANLNIDKEKEKTNTNVDKEKANMNVDKEKEKANLNVDNNKEEASSSVDNEEKEKMIIDDDALAKGKIADLLAMKELYESDDDIY
jgi:hypothetical protein